MARVPPWKAALDRVIKRRRPSVEEILDALDRVNPTGRDVASAEAEARYAAKATWQTLLIERHGHRVTLRPDGEGFVLQLSGGRDAKHVVRHQLGEPAQAWFAAELARLHIPDEPIAGVDDEPAAPGRPAREEEQVDACLAEGDYDGAVEALADAVRAGDVAAAVQTLELLLDYLDRPAEALALELSGDLRSAPAVATLLAVAHVRTGDLDAARRRLQGVSFPAASTGWLALARAALRAHELPTATEAAQRLLDHDPMRADEARRCLDEVRTLRESELAPDLEALEQAWEAGDLDRAESLATTILDHVPSHGPTQRRLREVGEARQHREGLTALAEGRAALDASRWADAVIALGRAETAGVAEAPALRAQAEAGAAEHARARQVADVVHAVRADADYRRYLSLRDADRAEVRAQLAALDPEGRLEVLTALEGCPRGSPAVRIRAVTAWLEGRDGPPDRVIDALTPHRRVLAQLPEAQARIQACAEELEARAQAAAQAVLQRAEAAAERGDLAAASTLLDEVSTGALGADDRERHQRLRADVDRRDLILRREAQIRREIETTPALAMARAGGLAQQQPDRAEAWGALREEARAALARQLRVRRADSPTGDAPTTGIVVTKPQGGPVGGLDLERGSAWVVDDIGPWRVVSELALGTPSLRRSLALHAGFGGAGMVIRVDPGGRAWMDCPRVAVCLDLETGQVLDAVPRDADGESAGRCIPIDGQGAWARSHEGWGWWPAGGGRRDIDPDVIAVVEVAGSAGAVLVTTRSDRTVRLHRPGRAPVPFTDPLMLGTYEASIDPEDPDRLQTISLTTDERFAWVVVDTRTGTCTVRRRFPWREDHPSLAAARELGLTYLHVPTTNAKPGDLYAYDAAGGMVFQCSVPDGFLFVTEPEARRVAYSVLDVEVVVSLLEREPPRLAAVLTRWMIPLGVPPCAALAEVAPPPTEPAAATWRGLQRLARTCQAPRRVAGAVLSHVDKPGWQARWLAGFLDRFDDPVARLVAAQVAVDEGVIARAADLLQDLQGLASIDPRLEAHRTRLQALVALATGDEARFCDLETDREWFETFERPTRPDQPTTPVLELGYVQRPRRALAVARAAQARGERVPLGELWRAMDRVCLSAPFSTVAAGVALAEPDADPCLRLRMVLLGAWPRLPWAPIPAGHGIPPPDGLQELREAARAWLGTREDPLDGTVTGPAHP